MLVDDALEQHVEITVTGGQHDFVDMIGGAWEVQGLERTRERAWVAQEWWVRQVGM